MRGYIATFHDASYSSLGSLEDVGEWFPSIREAREALWDRRYLGRSVVVTPAWDGDGYLCRNGWKSERFDFPSVTEAAYIDLFPVLNTEDGPIPAGEPSIRLVIGPRGGIQRHNF